MDEINFIDRRGRKMSVYKPKGAYGTSYSVTANNYYMGAIVWYLGQGWTACPNSEDLPPEYWAQLVEWVKNNENNQQEKGG